MIRIDVRGVDAVKKELDRIRRDLREKALGAALNKVGQKARTEMVRAITSEFAIKAGDVRPRMSLSRATRGNLVVVLDPYASRRRGRSLNLIRFLEKKVSLAEGRRRAKAGTRNQLHFQIKRSGGKKQIPGAFIGNKGRTVFRRVGKDRLPIAAVSTIDVPQMFATRRIQARVLARIRKEIGVEVERAVRMVLRGR
jgi:hypothetical protein